MEPLYCRHSWVRKVSLIERCPHFGSQNVHNHNVWNNTSSSLIIGGPYFRVSLFQGCPYFRMSLFQGCPYFRMSLFQGVLISGCPYFRSVVISGCPYFRGVLTSRGMSLFQEYPNRRVPLYYMPVYYPMHEISWTYINIEGNTTNLKNPFP